MFTRATCTAALTVGLSTGCALSPAACLKRQTRSEVFKISGTVPAGQTVSQLVPYGIEGSQNDLSIRWEGQGKPGGPRLRMFATRIECTPDKIAAGAGTGDCSYLARGGGGGMYNGEFVQQSLTITHGRGNPERLGPTNSYRLWVVGDPGLPATYTIASESFSGPDC